MSFVGREKELEALSLLVKKNTASMVVMKGRRRIGKSRLCEEFAKPYRFYQFSGMPPTKATIAQDQRNEFSRQFSLQFQLPAFQMQDWGDLFTILAKQVQQGRVIILLDEISWMGSKDPNFLGKLKIVWDLLFNKNNQLILILCGSVSAWIEDNIIKNTGFLGRISLEINLTEFPIKEANLFLNEVAPHLSIYEKLKVLSVTGGVPKYLEEIQGQFSAKKNVENLCFKKSGFLYNEFKKIFHDIFGKRGDFYKNIVCALSGSSRTYNEICEVLELEKSGAVSHFLEELILSDFVSRDYSWSIKDGKLSRLSRFRLSDNYLRFYLKYVDKNYVTIEQGNFNPLNFSWDAIMGLQFENLVLKNRDFIYQQLNISKNEVLLAGPYFQRKTLQKKGCQIDLMIQTRQNVLYVCEIKFSKNSLKVAVIGEMKEKLKRLSLPRGFSFLPVLIHVNGVDEKLEYEKYFSCVIDFCDALKT